MTNIYKLLAGRLAQFARPTKESYLRKIEAFVIGRPIWQLASRFYDRKLEWHLPPEGGSQNKERESAVMTRRLRAKANRARERVLFGRKMNFAMRRAIHEILNDQRLRSIQRDLIYGRVVNPKGEVSMPTWKRHLLIVLGAIWHSLAIIICVLLLIFVWSLSGSITLKLLASIPITALYLFWLGHINSISIRPVMAVNCIIQNR